LLFAIEKDAKASAAKVKRRTPDLTAMTAKCSVVPNGEGSHQSGEHAHDHWSNINGIGQKKVAVEALGNIR
jgi:hypothetical protein